MSETMSEHEKYLFLHGAMRGLKLRLERAQLIGGMLPAWEIEEMLDTIKAVLRTAGDDES